MNSHPFDSGIKFIQAKNYTWVSPAKPRYVTLIVIHSMEAPDKPSTAESVAAWFAGASAPQASAHVCVDTDSAVVCVEPKDIAWACSGGNWLSYNAELAGYAKQTEAEWLAPPNLAMLRIGATHLAKAAAYFALPAIVLDEDEVADCLRDSCIRQGKITGTLSGATGGLTTHVMVNAAWRHWQKYGLPQPKGDLSHSDPGGNFPLQVLAQMMAPAGPEPFPLGEVA